MGILPFVIMVIGVLALIVAGLVKVEAGTGGTFAALRQTLANQVMIILVSLVVLGAALYVILSRAYDADAQKWAFGAVGVVLGFWLRPP